MGEHARRDSRVAGNQPTRAFGEVSPDWKRFHAKHTWLNFNVAQPPPPLRRASLERPLTRAILGRALTGAILEYLEHLEQRGKSAARSRSASNASGLEQLELPSIAALHSALPPTPANPSKRRARSSSRLFVLRQLPVTERDSLC